MSVGHRSRFSRPFAALLLAAAALLLGGCVYLRLLELKKQFANFDRYFQVDYEDGLKLTCHEPVLLDKDMTFFKLVPEKRDRLGSAERWHFRWIKAGDPPNENPGNYEVTADFIFSRHKLSKVVLPDRLFAFFPKPLFVGMLRSLGDAKVDRAKRTANTNFNTQPGSPAVEPMTEDQVLAMLGVPMEKSVSPEGEVWRYRYKKATPDQRSGSIDVTLLFHPEDRKVARLKGRIFDATIDFKFSRPTNTGVSVEAPR